MSLISSSIPNIVNGVSQQPAVLRLTSQGAEQINGYSSVVDGLRKRPGTYLLKQTPDVSGGLNTAIHTINRDKSERYVVLVDSAIRVFTIDGQERTVTIENDSSYFASSNPKEKISLLTVSDYTFVLNKDVAVRMAADTSPVRQPEALVWVKQGSYGATYKVFVDGSQRASYSAPDGSSSEMVTQVATDYIATQLTSGLTSSIGSTFNVARYGSTIHLSRKDGGEFTLSTSDSAGDTALLGLKGKVQRFSDLPATAVDGFQIEVVGDQSSGFANYYVKYESSTDVTTRGVWRETVKGGEKIKLDASTMPHALVRNADGTFTFKRLDWSDRTAGDTDSVPFPSIVDSKLNDMFFHRNRLGFVCDENVVFSRAGDFFNFFSSTATDTLDDDPIDVRVSHTKVSILRYAIPFNKTLMLFSDQTQFQLGDVDLLTPKTISINQTTEFECSLLAKPKGAGRNLYFSVSRGTYSGMREYYVDGVTETNDALEITGHVPNYIPGEISKIAISGTENCMVALAGQAPNQIFVYKYHWSNNEKLQSSWSRWIFAEGDEILDCEFIESRLYLVVRRAGQLHLEMMNLEPGSVETSWTIQAHLDGKVSGSSVVSRSFDEVGVVTTVRIPGAYRSTDTYEAICTAESTGKNPGYSIPVVSTSGTATYVDLVLKGDYRNVNITIGRKYAFRYKFSPMMVREQSSGGGQMAMTEGRTQLRNASITFANAGYFRVEVTPFRRDTFKYVFSGRVLGSAKSLLGQLAIEDGVFRFPIAAKNDQVEIELINDSYLPSAFLSVNWEALLTVRSRRT